MRQLHEIMPRLHGLPVIRKRMFIMPAVLFLRSKRRFDVPAVSRSPVAARDPISGGQWLGRDPGPDAMLGLALRIRPGFFTLHHMDRDGVGLAPAVLVGIEDVIDPG